MEKIEIEITNTAMPRSYFEQVLLTEAAREAEAEIEIMPVPAAIERRHGAVELVALVFEVGVVAGPAVARFVSLVKAKVAARGSDEQVTVKDTAGYL